MMILPNLIKKRLPEWGEKMFGMTDFEQICSRERIIFVEGIGRKHKGEFIPHANRDMIILRAGLAECERRWIAYHELGHYFLHAAGHHFSRTVYRRMDKEANFFAAIALLPKCVVEKDEQTISDGYYPPEFIQIRFEILKEYGL